MTQRQFFSLRRLGCALCASLKGLRRVWRDETAFRQEVVIAVFLTPLTFFLEVSAGERALLLAMLFLVLLTELLNSALEAIVDLASPEKHSLAEKAKDAASAAVMVSIVAVFVVWAAVLWPF